MGARLEWAGKRVVLGPFVLAVVDEDANRLWRHGLMGARLSSDPYESIVDCMQDCEAEVRRLLRESGVVVE